MYDTEQIINEILQSLPDVQGIYIFGSAGTKFERAESDVDLAILLDKKLDPLKRWELSQEIAREINKDVDLIDLRQVSTVLQFQVVSSGKRIFCLDSYTCDLFETFVYSSYQFLNEERKEILEDIRKRGRIYD